MPEDFASREHDNTVHPKTGEHKALYEWGLQRFVDEARTLAKFNHPNIVRVLSVFEENNTAYMIMEYAQGRDLSGLYAEPLKMSEDELLDIFIPIMDGLSLVHNAGFIHRDIKPANIYIRDNNSPLLLDFGSARQSIGDKTKTLTSLVTYGYAPFEQYNEGSGKQGVWTDIYSLGASLYVGVTGNKPADALSRGGGFIDKGLDTCMPASIIAKGEYSDNFLLAIDKALMFKIEDRPADILQCADMLQGKIRAPELPDFMMNAIKDAGVDAIRDSSGAGSTRFSRQVSGLSSEVELAETLSIRSSQGDGQGLENARIVRQARNNNRTVVRNKAHARDTKNGGLDEPVVNISESELMQMRSGLSRNGPTRHGPAKHGSAIDSHAKPLLTRYRPVIALLMVSILAVVVAGVLLNQPSVNQPSVNQPSGPDSREIEKPNQLAQQRARQNAQKEQQRERVKQKQQKKRIDRLIVSARRLFLDGNYVTPADENAYAYYQQVLGLQAGHSAALDGLNKIEKRLFNLASSAFMGKKYKQALNYLDQLGVVNADSSAAKSLYDKLKLEQSHNAQIKIWLEGAKEYIKGNRFTRPPGKNAHELYKKILSLQPGNIAAQQGIADIQQRYIVLFEKHISAAHLNKARRDLQTMDEISVARSDIEKMQRILVLAKKKQHAKKIALDKSKQKKLSDVLLMQKISQFTTAIQTGNKHQLKQMSQFLSGRERFVEDLFAEYKNINVKISSIKLIASKNKGHARVILNSLVDTKGRRVSVEPGGWNRFEITLSYNSRNQLKVIW